MSFFHSTSVKDQNLDYVSKIAVFCWHYSVFDFVFIGSLLLPFIFRWFIPNENLAVFYLAATINSLGFSITALCLAVDMQMSPK